MVREASKNSIQIRVPIGRSSMRDCERPPEFDPSLWQVLQSTYPLRPYRLAGLDRPPTRELGNWDGPRDCASAVALVSFALLGLGLRLPSNVGFQAPTNVVRLFELSLLVASDEALVGSCVDEFARHCLLLRPAKNSKAGLCSARHDVCFGSKADTPLVAGMGGKQILRWPRDWGDATAGLMRVLILNAGSEKLQPLNFDRSYRGVELNRANVVFQPDDPAPRTQILGQEENIFAFRREPITTEPHARAGDIEQRR